MSVTTTIAACAAAVVLPLAALAPAPALAATSEMTMASADPAAAPAATPTAVRVDMLFEATGSGITVAPGQVVDTVNVLNMQALAGGAAIPANTATLTVSATGPAVVGASKNLFSVGYGGTYGLGGCTGRGTAVVVCTGGNPFTMQPGGTTSFNHVRVPFTVAPDALPGDVITLTSTVTMHDGWENTNPVQSVEWRATVPLTAATLDTTGTVGPTPTLTGHGVPGGTVDVSVAGRPAVTAPVGTDGVWRVAIAEPLSDGPAAVVVVQHRNGFTAPATTGSVVVDATAPAAPAVDDPGTWQDGTGALAGTAEPGSTVVVRDATGGEIGRATTDPVTGAWTLPVTTPLPEGTTQLVVVATDPHGNASPGTAVAVTVPDTTAPSAPVLATTEPFVDGVGVVSGTAEPGSTVVVRDAAGGEIGRGTADASTGAFDIDVTVPAREGEHRFTVVAEDAAGNVSEAAAGTATVPDTTAPMSPVAQDPGTWQDGTGTLVGTAEPGAEVVVRDADGNDIGRATADPVTGDWTLVVTEPLPEGHVALVVVARDAAGNESEPTGLTVVVPDTTAPTAPEIDAPGTWHEATGPLTGTAEPGSTVVVRDAVGIVVGTGTADADGRFSIVLDRPLPSGASELEVTATDAAGNVSGAAVVTVEVVALGGGSTSPALRPGGIVAPDASSAPDAAVADDRSATAAKRLAFTGTDGLGAVAAAAGLLVLLGAVLRRRRAR